MSNKPTQSAEYIVEILTPVHIGTGEELFLDYDYATKDEDIAVLKVLKDNEILVVDKNSLFDILANRENFDDKLRDKIKEITNLKDLIEIADNGGEHSYILKFFKEKIDKPNRIREHIKDAFFRPYIPGSSIKGAIRTAFLAELIRNMGLSAIKGFLPKKVVPLDSKTASEALLRKLFSKTAPNEKDVSNFDFSRLLHISDTQFGNDELRLAKIECVNVKRLGGSAIPIMVELLTPTKKATLTLQIDNFLLKEHAQSVLRWKDKDLIPELVDFFNDASFDKLAYLLNNHAKERLEAEQKLFSKNPHLNLATQECDRILRLMTKNPKAAYLQIGWGNGWNGMTGDWMDADTKKKLIGKDEPFAKTRRLVVKDRKPCLPLGWLRILPPQKEEIKLPAEEQILNNLQQDFETAIKSREKPFGVLFDKLNRLLNEGLNSPSSDYRSKLACKIEEIYTKLDWWGNSDKKKKKKEKLDQLRENKQTVP